MKIKKVLSLGHINDGFRGAQHTKHLTGNQRVSLLEELRRESARIFHYEYPRRLRKVLKVIEQHES